MNTSSSESVLFEYLPRTTIDEVCGYLAKTTNMFTGVMDYQGKMVCLYMGGISCNLCRQRRVQNENATTCQRIDSFAAIEAARRKEAFMYVCPYGLIDMCAPIIIGNRYQGAIFMGQVLSDKETLESLPRVNIPLEDNPGDEHRLMELYKQEKQKLRTVSANDLKIYSDLLNYVAKYLSEVGYSCQMNEKLERMSDQIEQISYHLNQTEKHLLTVKNQLTQSLSIHEFITNSLNSINQFTILEEAPHTYSSIQRLSRILQYLLDKNDNLITVEQETSILREFISLENDICRQIKVHLNINITTPELLIPKFLLIHPTENAYRHAFSPDTENPELDITLSEDNSSVKIIIRDNGTGIPDQVTSGLLQYMITPDTRPPMRSGLYLILQNMRFLYGDKFHFDIDSHANTGTSIFISFPKMRSLHD